MKDLARLKISPKEKKEDPLERWYAVFHCLL